eukprot:6833575-Pyramimonas_sp.AAC.1
MRCADWVRFVTLPLTFSAGIASTSETAQTVVDLVDPRAMRDEPDRPLGPTQEWHSEWTRPRSRS